MDSHASDTILDAICSDACVVANKPLVSAAAVGTDGQLTVYHYGEDGADYIYRWIWI